MPRITLTAVCIAVIALMAPTLTAQPTAMYVGASYGTARLTAPRGNFPRTTTPTISAWAGLAVTRGLGFEARLTGLNAHVTERRIPGVIPLALYTRGVTAVLLEPAVTYRHTGWNTWRLKPSASVGVVLAALRISQESDTPEEWSRSSDAGLSGALGLEAVLQRHISLVGRASYRGMFNGSSGPQRGLGITGPALEFGVCVNR